MCEKISLQKFLPAASAAADNEHAFISESPFVNKRRFDVDSDGVALDVAIDNVIVVDPTWFPMDVQCDGGCGNEFGAGASKYLDPAKYKFGGDRDTPAGDANDIGDRGEFRPLPCGLPFW